MLPRSLPSFDQVLADIKSCTGFSEKRLAENAGVGKNRISESKGADFNSRRELIRELLAVCSLSFSEYLERRRRGTLKTKPSKVTIADLDNAFVLHSILNKLEKELLLSSVEEKDHIRNNIQDARARIINANVLTEIGLRPLEPDLFAVQAAEAACGVHLRDDDGYNIEKNSSDSRRLHKDGLSVSVSVDSVGPLAALLGMQNNSEIYGFPLRIRIEGKNGADQVNLLKKKQHDTAFAVFGLPSFSLNYGTLDYLQDYRLLIPLFSIEQAVLKQRGELRRVFYCPSGFAELQQRANAGLSQRYSTVRADSISPLGVAPHLNKGEGVIAFDPIAQWLATQHQLETQSDSSYRVNVGLFKNHVILKSTHTERLQAEFVRAFVKEYRICTRNRKYSLGLLANCPEFVDKYCIACGFPPYVHRK
jgi:hypothetical protein